MSTYGYIKHDEMSDYAIAHHGIKGQKWGIRRFQNPDGSLTPEGMKRYYNSDGKLTKYATESLNYYNLHQHYKKRAQSAIYFGRPDLAEEYNYYKKLYKKDEKYRQYVDEGKIIYDRIEKEKQDKIKKSNEKLKSSEFKKEIINKSKDKSFVTNVLKDAAKLIKEEHHGNDKRVYSDDFYEYVLDAYSNKANSDKSINKKGLSDLINSSGVIKEILKDKNYSSLLYDELSKKGLKVIK